MNDEDPAQDFASPAAALLMDAAFGLNGFARFLAKEAHKEEQAERDRQRKRAEGAREADRLRKQRQRANARLTAQTQNSVPTHDQDAA